MSTATEKGIVSLDHKKVPVLAGQKQDVEDIQPVLDPDDETSRYLEMLRNEYGPSWRKIAIGVMFSLGQLVTLMSASMIAAALGDISRDLKIDKYTAQILFSTYFLGAGGGITICITANRSIAQRSSTDCCYSSKLTGPVLADIYGKRERGKSLAIASFLPYRGPALGPIFGGIIAQLVVWPWIFWTMLMFNSLLPWRVTVSFENLIHQFFFDERSNPKLCLHLSPKGYLKLNIDKNCPLDYLLDLSVLSDSNTSASNSINHIRFWNWLWNLHDFDFNFCHSLYRTLQSDCINQRSSLYSNYHWCDSCVSNWGSYHRLRIMDWQYRSLSNKNNNHGRPEFCVPYSIGGAILIPIGLFWYGWVAEVTGTWIVVDIGASVFTLGNMVFSQDLLAYQLD
ncbi:hypothetical protein EAF00_001357 [Botryotinia globosa]|nr:hypothetical protein EAF00_001357 [Botryotinia globosa]